MAGLAAILSLPSPSPTSTLPSCYFPLRNTRILSKPLASSSPTSVAQDDDAPLSPDSVPLPAADLSFRGCKACGRDDLERGCNGEGRIQGGIATVPGFGWWPIKAYRPCPGFVASGGRYRRTGQSMDEVAFGRPEKRPSSSAAPALALARKSRALEEGLRGDYCAREDMEVRLEELQASSC